MKNSLFLAPCFPPYPGGAETYARDLTFHLSNYGWRSFVITDKFDSRQSDQLVSKELQDVIFLDAPIKELEDITQVTWRVLQFGILNKIDTVISKLPSIDIVHANSMETAILGRMIADHLSIPLVATIHEHAPEKKPFGQGLCQLIFQRLGIDALIAPSDFYFSRAVKLGFPVERIHQIIHGVSQERLTTSSKNSTSLWDVPSGSVVVVVVARIYPPKGISTLIEAAKILKKDPRFRLIIVGPDGPGPYAPEIRERIKTYKLEDIVQLTGEVSPSKIPAILTAADIIVAPSLAEGFGLSVVEAMLLGKPVIASNVGGLAQIIRNDISGLLVEPGNIEGFVAAINKLMNSPELAVQLSMTAKKDALNRFSADRMAAETGKIYNHLIANGK